MFDTMTITKVGGAFCGVWLVYLLGGWLADELYKGPHHSAEAYVIEVAAAGAAADTGPSLAELLAEASVEDGEAAFRACASCHSITEGDHGTGPSLYGMVGRDKGSKDGFGYSTALAEVPGVWGPEELDGFIENPRGYLNGTTMGYGGMGREGQRADLIAYLDTLDGVDNLTAYIEAELAEAAAAEEEAGAEESETEAEASSN